MNPPNDEFWMRQAIELAKLGEGRVEPNPMVGCLVVLDQSCIGKGYHSHFGGPHAEVEALRGLRPEQVREATLYVTLEPCCHHGKTPPCTDLILQYRPKRIVIATHDPFPKVAGGGIQLLRAAGLEVTTSVAEADAQHLLAPYLKRQLHHLPWTIAKWAMSLDGRLATRSGDSRWISNEASRGIVHSLRGRVDAILVGIGTALADDPELTARPSSLRTAKRVILDRQFRLPLHSKLATTANQCPVWIFGDRERFALPARQLEQLGCVIHHLPSQLSDPLDPCPPPTSPPPTSDSQRLRAVLQMLSQADCTNVLIEGGSRIFGASFDGHLVDEVHAFIGNRIIGGSDAPAPVAGEGPLKMAMVPSLQNLQWSLLGSDAYATGRLPFSTHTP